MNHNTITVTRVMLYGNEVFRPVCNKARVMAEIAGTKTLTYPVLKQLPKLGFRIIVLGDGGAERAQQEFNQTQTKETKE